MAREVAIRRGGRIIVNARVCGQRDVFPDPPGMYMDRPDGRRIRVDQARHPNGARIPLPAGWDGCWIGHRWVTAREYDQLAYNEEPKMDEQKHKAVMEALAELIRSQLEGQDRGRFACVKRLAVIGQKLMTEMRPCADDAMLNANFENGDDIGDDAMGDVYPRRLRRGAIIGPGDDQQQMVREMMALIGPAMSGLHSNNEARRRSAVAQELSELVDVRARLEAEPVADRGAIARLTKRIDAILAAIEEEKQPEGDEDGLHVVSAVDVRRHQAEPDGRVIDAAYADGPRADGEGRGAGALRAGDEARGAPGGVGFGG